MCTVLGDTDMAKSSRNNRSPRRDASAISSPRLFVAPYPVRVSPSRLADLAARQDLRNWTPANPDPLGFFRSAVRTVPRSIPADRSFRVPSQIGFNVPSAVVLCERRSRRREVIFARGKAGSGQKRRRPRRAWSSQFSCK